MVHSVREIREIYRRMAPAYDRRARIFRLMGFNERRYKRETIDALDLGPGSTVVDIGCGTGLNFAMLQERIGDNGRIIGLDLTPEMLAEAAQRVEQERWKNVTLVEADAAAFIFPRPVDAVLSAFALSFVPGFETVIENGMDALRRGGKFAVLDMKRNERLPLWMVRIGALVTAPFGVTLDMSRRKPWEVMKRLCPNTRIVAYYGGSIYAAIAQKD